MIKAILFDMGGVLVDLDMSRCISAFKTRVGFERIEEFLDPCHQKGFIKQMESGQIDEQEFYEQCRQYCRPGTRDEDIAASLSELLVDIPADKVKLMRELSASYTLYMLSNNNPIAMRRSKVIFAQAGIPMDEVFRETFVSCDLHLLKPGREIYMESVRRTGLSADELLFIDDSRNNVAAASSVGINAIYYERGTDLRSLIMGELSRLNEC